MKKMIFESELKIMEILWNDGSMRAADLAIKLMESVEWSKTTTYTVIKKCVAKGLIEREGKNFMCHALITREEAQRKESELLIDKMFDGSSNLLIASLLGGSSMSDSQARALRDMIQHFIVE